MSRTLTAKRIYRMGDYENLELTDVMDSIEIPDALLANDSYVEKLALYQLLRLEARYIKYLEIRRKIRGISPEEATVMLEEQISAELAELAKLTKKTGE